MRKDIHYIMVYTRFLLAALILFLIPLNTSVAQPRFNAAPKKVSAAKEKEDAKKSDTAKKADDGTVINVKNADISALVRIFSEKTKRNFILDERVKGKVSLYLPQQISAEESLKILDAVLSLKGFTTVPIGENLWKIIPSKEAIQSTIPTLSDDGEIDPLNASASVVTRLVHLKFINADDAKQILTPLVSSSGLINAYTGTNSLIIIDSEDNIERVLELVQNLDVSSRGREMTIIPIKFADATDIAAKLQEILGENDDKTKAATDPRTAALNSIRARLNQRSNGSSSPSRASGSTVAAAATTASTISARSLAPKIIADERTNSVIIIADDETTARIRALIAQLDSETNKSGFRFYVYRCLHANAEELAEVLSGLAGGNTGVGGGARDNNPLGLNRNSRNRGGQFESTQNRLGSQNRTPGRSRQENTGGRVGPTSVNFGDDLSITSDPATNSLIIYAGKADYEKILALLEDLDIKPRQVLVEAVLLEVQLDESVTEDFEFLGSTGGSDGGAIVQSSFGGNLANLISDPAALSNFTVAAASSGTLTLPGGFELPTQSILMNAARNNNIVNILSSPNILATDNQQAEIVVGQNVPFIASTSTSDQNLNNTFNTVDRQDVGITLRITPQISSNDTVRLDIFTEVSSVLDASASSDLGPTTTIRTSETTAIAKSNQMIVIGGLMSDQVNEVETGVPFLMDVPVLGYFFRSSIDRQTRTNLLIFITPRIIRDEIDHREVTMDQRDDTRAAMDEIGANTYRDDLLFSQNIDNVMKAEDFEGTPPTTILPQKEVLRQQQKAQPVGTPRTFRFKAKPPVPKFSSEAANVNTPADNNVEQVAIIQPPKEPLKPTVPTITARKKTSSNSRYVLARITNEPSGKLSAPFLGMTKPETGMLVALQIPPSANHLADSMAAGKRFRYGPEDQSGIQLQTEGVFASSSEASLAAQQTINDSSWYILSPFEIMNFGKGPWYKN